jgi:hypothetical protein
MQFDWPYLTLRQDGTLVYDTGHPVPKQPQPFKDAVEADAWLVAEDIRGTVREAV